VPATGSSGTVSVASDATERAKPPVHSYCCSACETDVIVSMIDGSVNIRFIATSNTFSGSWGVSRSITPTLGKSMYRIIASSITSSTVTAPMAEEVSTTSAVGEGPSTSAAGKAPTPLLPEKDPPSPLPEQAPTPGSSQHRDPPMMGEASSPRPGPPSHLRRQRRSRPAAPGPPEGQPLLAQKVHSTPITQQAEQSWLRTRREQMTCQSIFPEN
jgi:hypothetical protein